MKKIIFIFFFNSVSSFVFAQIVADSLQAMYSFNNGTAEDDIGPWDGIPVNATLIPDRFGNPNHAYWLNGTPNNYIKLGTTSVLKPVECSISMWVRVDSLITSGTGYYHNIMLVTKCQTGNNFYEAYAFYYNISTHKIIAVTTTAPSNQQVVYSINQNALHVWYHLVMTFDYSKIKFYIDGVYQGQLTKNYATVYLPSDSVMIGNSCNTQNSRYYRGAVDDLRFYNRVISPLEVDSLYNEQNPSLNSLPLSCFSSAINSVCIGNCISFNNCSSSNSTSWQWSFPGGTPSFSSLQNPPLVCYNYSGNYNVTLISANANGTDTMVMSNYISVSNFPQPTITQSGDTLFCSPAVSYQWYFNAALILGATNIFYLPANNGNYSCSVTNSNGCMGTDTINFSFAVPVAMFSAEDIKICPSSCISFSSSSQNGSSFEWFFQGASPNYSTQENPTNICYSTSGSYNVTLVVHNGPFSDTLTIQNFMSVYAAPNPVIIQSNDTLYCTGISGPNSYQWYLNGVVILGAVNNFLVESGSGNYSVQVTNSNECSTFDSLEVIHSALINILPHEELFFYPNPASDYLKLIYNGNKKIISIKIYNAIGEKMWEEEKSESNRWEINMEEFSSGIYFLHVKFSNSVQVFKFEKQN